MDFTTNALLSLAIGIGAIIGRIRYRQIDPAFHPFLYLVWVSFFCEGASIALMYNGFSTVILFNAFILAEATLLFEQFHRWQVIRRRWVTRSIQLFLFSFWAFECLYTSFQIFASYFVIFYSASIVALSIACINRLLFKDLIPLYRHPVFLLCSCFILYFSFSTLVEVAWMIKLEHVHSFRLSIHAILCYINLFTNLVFAFTLLWMPTRFRSILLS